MLSSAKELKVKDPAKVVGLLVLSVIASGNGLSGSDSGYGYLFDSVRSERRPHKETSTGSAG